MAVTRTPRDEWVEKGLLALADGGPDAVRVEALARELGVTKGGFYWHFDDRQALLDEVLDAWEQTGVGDVVDQVEAEGGDGRARLRKLFALAATGGQVAKVDLAVRNWARHDTAVAERLRRVDNRRMAYLRELFGDFVGDDAEVEARCLQTMALYIGSRFMATDHGTRTRREVLALALERLLT